MYLHTAYSTHICTRTSSQVLRVELQISQDRVSSDEYQNFFDSYGVYAKSPFVFFCYFIM